MNHILFNHHKGAFRAAIVPALVMLAILFAWLPLRSAPSRVNAADGASFLSVERSLKSRSECRQGVWNGPVEEVRHRLEQGVETLGEAGPVFRCRVVADAHRPVGPRGSP